MNLFRTAILMAFLTGLFIAIGYLIGGESGMLIAFLFAAASNIFAYWNSDKLVLRMYGAREVDEQSGPELVHLVGRLAANAGIPMPKVYIAENPQPNAFATGRDPHHAAVCVTTGLLDQLSYEELAGVVAHELAHVKNRDTLIMTITATLAGAISMLANLAFFMGGRDRNNPLGPLGAILIMVVAPLAAMLVQMAISRAREFEADREGAMISGRPLWLASALRNISSGVRHIDNVEAERNPATAHLFIINPLHGVNGLSALFATHPSTEQRVAKLRAMATEMGQAPDSGPWS